MGTTGDSCRATVASSPTLGKTWNYIFIVGSSFVGAAQMFAIRGCLAGDRPAVAGSAQTADRSKIGAEVAEAATSGMGVTAVGLMERKYHVVLSNEWDPLVMGGLETVKVGKR